MELHELMTNKLEVEVQTVKFEMPWSIIESLPKVAVAIPDIPVVFGRNSESAFGMEPIDETRLAELLAFLQGIGLPAQTITVRRSTNEYALIDITFAQLDDPRVKP